MSVPKIIGQLETVAGKIEETAPVIRNAYETISTTIAGGKHPTPAPEQLPSKTAGGLTPEQGAQAINAFLWIGVAAVVIIIWSAGRRR